LLDNACEEELVCVRCVPLPAISSVAHAAFPSLTVIHY
jgi:hypothetical protein